MTKDIEELNRTRAQWQSMLDAQKDRKDRNVWGQFATPYRLAHDIMELVRRYSPGKTVSFLEPSIGLGSFYAAFLEVFGEEAGHALGFEIDSHYFHPACELWKGHDIQLRHEDFLLANTSGQKFDIIVANPPYTRHHFINAGLKAELQKRVLAMTGIKMSGLAGLYCYFLILSTQWLNAGGLSCWLIPTEFMDVNYGRALKQYLTEHVELIRIHRFESDNMQFDDALVNSTVVLFRNNSPTRSGVVFSAGASLKSPTLERLVPFSALDYNAKWSLLIKETTAVADKASNYALGDFFQVSRGIATGGNKFFILSPKVIRAYNIPEQYLTPVLPSPRYVDGNIIGVDGMGEATPEETRYLFTCGSSKSFLRDYYPGVLSYIERGEAEKVDKGYICSRRKPWYACEERAPAPFVVPYMGRGAASKKMFRFILNRSRAVTTNVYLLLYPKKEYANCLKDPDVLLQVWEALNEIPAEVMAESGREYGGGLHKLEPKELLTVQAPSVAAILLNSKRAKEPCLF